MVSARVNQLSWTFMASQIAMLVGCVGLMSCTRLRERGIALTAAAMVILLSVTVQLGNIIDLWPWCNDTYTCVFSKSHILATLVSVAINLLTITTMFVVTNRFPGIRYENWDHTAATVASTVYDDPTEHGGGKEGFDLEESVGSCDDDDDDNTNKGNYGDEEEVMSDSPSTGSSSSSSSSSSDGSLTCDDDDHHHHHHLVVDNNNHNDDYYPQDDDSGQDGSFSVADV